MSSGFDMLMEKYGAPPRPQVEEVQPTIKPEQVEQDYIELLELLNANMRTVRAVRLQAGQYTEGGFGLAFDDRWKAANLDLADRIYSLFWSPVGLLFMERHHREMFTARPEEDYLTGEQWQNLTT